MKYAIVLFLIITLSSGCVRAHGKIDAAAVRQNAADVPPVDAKTQSKAADEAQSGMCPALTTLAGMCLVTRDQSRAMQSFKP